MSPGLVERASASVVVSLWSLGLETSSIDGHHLGEEETCCCEPVAVGNARGGMNAPRGEAQELAVLAGVLVVDEIDGGEKPECPVDSAFCRQGEIGVLLHEFVDVLDNLHERLLSSSEVVEGLVAGVDARSEQGLGDGPAF